MKSDFLGNARSELIRNNLMAWESPVYQVLSLDPVAFEKRSTSETMRLGEILNRARGVAHD